jgi:hypothetical protein
MLKKLVFLTLAFALCKSAYAISAGGTFNDPVHTYVAANSTFTVVQIAVSSSVPTQVDAATVAGRVQIEVENIDASANLWCGASVSISSTTASRKVAPGVAWVLPVSNQSLLVGNKISVYCVTDGAASTKAAITQLY